MSLDRLELTGWGVMGQRDFGDWLAHQQLVAFIPGFQVGHPGRSRAYNKIVGESWRPRRQNGKMDWIEGDPLLSAQHVGQIRLIARLSNTPYEEQQPSQKKVFLASYPEVLQAIDTESSEQHDKDARFHLWGYFFENWFTTNVNPNDTVFR